MLVLQTASAAVSSRRATLPKVVVNYCSEKKHLNEIAACDEVSCFEVYG